MSQGLPSCHQTIHILSIQLQTPQDVLHELCERFRSRRLAQNLIQE